MPRGLKTALRFLPLCLLALVVWREKPWTVQLSASAPWAVAASILVNFVVFLPLKAARWKVALTALSDPPPFRKVLAATIEGGPGNERDKDPHDRIDPTPRAM